LASRRLQILLTEGSSTSARQTLYALGRLGHVLDVCDPNPHFCLARFSRYVRTCYRCPPFSTDPEGYLDFLQARVATQRYDVLLPTHDQVFLVAQHAERFRKRVGLAVASFSALARLQSKAAFLHLLDELHLPHPPTRIVRSREELERASGFPFYVKLPYSTAGCGVWRVESHAELSRVANHLADLLDGETEVLVQQPAPGTLCVVQSVFSQGKLVAGHCYRARALGVGGSALARVSIVDPMVLDHVARLGGYLGWHGALMIDYLHDANAGPAYIDANPRIGETLNATLSGVNLCEQLVAVSLGQIPSFGLRCREGIRTHALFMALLARAQEGATRRQLLTELFHAWSKAGFYAGSQDELTRPRDDLLSLIPAAFLVVRLLATPRAAKRIVAKAVNNYALDEGTVRALRRLEE
jgi:predicted ATP-grasp superfamily ATP-dependent carboligase